MAERSTSERTRLTPDSITVHVSETGVNVMVVTPSNMESTQLHLFRAVRAAYAACGLLPQEWTQRITTSGNMEVFTSGSYCGWGSDPMLAEHREVIAKVMGSVLATYGYTTISP